MQKANLLVNFANEFLADRTLSQVDENIIINVKEETISLSQSTVAEYDNLFERIVLLNEDEIRFQRLALDLRRDLQFLKVLSPKNRKGRRWQPITSCDSSEEENFDQNTQEANFELLKTLLAKLELQARDWLTVNTEVRGLISDSAQNQHSQPRAFYELMVHDYILLTKNLMYNIEDSDFFLAVKPQLDEVRSRLVELQRSSVFQALRRVVTTTKKALRIMEDIVSVCRHLYCEKIVSPRPQPKRFASLVEGLDEQSPRPIIQFSEESITFSKPFSKIKCQRASISLDSFVLSVPNFLQSAKQEDLWNCRPEAGGNGQTTQASSVRQRKEKGGREGLDEGELDHVASRCFCIIF